MTPVGGLCFDSAKNRGFFRGLFFVVADSGAS
jgi:hypothetical protein